MRKGITAGECLTIGLDLGDRYSEAVVVDGSGDELERFRVRTTQPALDRGFARFAPARPSASHARSTSQTVNTIAHTARSSSRLPTVGLERSLSSTLRSR